MKKNGFILLPILIVIVIGIVSYFLIKTSIVNNKNINPTPVPTITNIQNEKKDYTIQIITPEINSIISFVNGSKVFSLPKQKFALNYPSNWSAITWDYTFLESSKNKWGYLIRLFSPENHNGLFLNGEGIMIEVSVNKYVISNESNDKSQPFKFKGFDGVLEYEDYDNNPNTLYEKLCVNTDVSKSICIAVYGKSVKEEELKLAKSIISSIIFNPNQQILENSYSWEKISKNGIEFTVPEIMVNKNSNELFYSLVGPTQRDGTEMYDGIMITFKPIDLKGKPANDYINEEKIKAEDYANKYKGEFTNPRNLTFDNVNGYLYETIGLGTFRNYVLTNGKNVIEIQMLVEDPTNQGFEQIVTKILNSIKI